MGHCVRIVLPDVDGLGTTDKLWTSESGHVPELIIGRIAERFGGVTISDGRGVWLDDNRRPINEHVFVVECSIGLWDQQTRDWWTELSDFARAELGQECVFLSVREEAAWLIGHDGMGPTAETIGPEVPDNTLANPLLGLSDNEEGV